MSELKDTVVYELDGNLYINLTNKCSNVCSFCVRNGKEDYYGHKLWLKKEPTAEEVLSEIKDVKKYRQVVFCGFGEPTYRIEVLREIGCFLKKAGAFVRLNTNGQGNLINGRDITGMLEGAVDKVNVSLNEGDADSYMSVCHSIFGKECYESIIDFAVKCKQRGIETVFSVVDVIGEKEIQKCREIADRCGIPLRVRALIK